MKEAADTQPIENLSQTHPHLSEQWHSTKNGKLTLSDVTRGSNKLVWWKCSKGEDHEWQAKVNDRVEHPGCMFCLNQRLSVTNSLQTLHPKFSEQWHPTKNGKLTPKDIVGAGSKQYWWKCLEGPDHEWETSVSQRVRSPRCGFCSNKRVSITNSLHTLHPKLAEEWHPTKNGNLSPKDVVGRGDKKYWWECPNKHEWQQSIKDRIKKNGTYNECQLCKYVPLTTAHPELAKEWHPTKNGNLSPKDVTDVNTQSTLKVWWKCPKGPDHEWENSVYSRVKSPRCGFCLNQRVSITNSLHTLHPKLAEEWHPTKNEILTPKDVVGTGGKKYWWQCQNDPKHEWQDSIAARIRKDGTNRECQLCKAIPLATTNPELAKEWHPTKNNTLSPADVVAGSATYAWWKCPKGDDHEWKTKVVERLKTGCPFCDNKKVSVTNSLETRHPDLAKEWHPTKNGNLTPNKVIGGGKKKYWWKCSKGPDHEWEATIGKRAIGRGCSICRGLKVVPSNSLEKNHPEITLQWHPSKNGNLTPSDIISGSGKLVWWQCPKNIEHEWKASTKDRVKAWQDNGKNCPFCSNQRICKSNSLATTNPELVKEWHPTKNGNLTPENVVEGSGTRVWWQCLENPDHEWETKVAGRKLTGCPLCNGGWSVARVRLFVHSLLGHIDQLTPAELYVIFQQHGVLNTHRKSQSFLQALKTKKFPKEELEKFVNEEPSLVDEFISDETMKLEEYDEQLLDEPKCISENEIDLSEEPLPIVETKDILAILDDKLTANMDKEAVEFFVNSATAKIWRHVFLDEATTLKQLEAYTGNGEYSSKVKKRFMEQYHGAVNLSIPPGYNFNVDGQIRLPNLMQRYTAFMIQKSKRFGNWSGTGAGKTLSAVLSSRVIDAKLSIICCPNSVVEGWKENIESIYPDSIVMTKDLTITSNPDLYQYIILNYEFFQQPNSENKLKDFLNRIKVDFVVIDEIHYSKQRKAENISKRKKVISAMLAEAATHNENLHVLGMSATPVINNLFEGKTLIELITGFHHDELNTKPTIGNCIALYQKFVSNGVRWVPQYRQHLNVNTIEVDCREFLEEIKNVSINGSMVDLESVLTKAKIPEILKHLKPKTIVYTHYIKNILSGLEEAIQNDGWKTAIYSGDDKTGFKEFLHGDAEVLIATSCIGTGLDGLQSVCDRIIINILPWTNAEFEQLKGRVYRQGQVSDNVDIIIPLTHASVGGERWSWCDSRWKRIQFKKSLADSAVDGVIPEGHLRSPSQAYQDVMKWLTRLENGGVHEIERRKINIPLSGEEQKVGYRKFGDFSKMNRLFNTSSSSTTHQRLSQNPEEWEHYHSLYRDARKDWPVVPFNEAIKWCKARPHLVVGDFGCGEALLAKEVENKIYSFDHMAINDDVIVCDVSHVPIDDESLDAAIFSLSLMGTNYLDYIKEAHRCLKLDGHLWIAEATSRYQNLSSLEEKLSKIGFDLVRNQEKGSFTFLRLIKSER